jgi:two-component system, NarL family, nitrate/nitrite response regulator NarL
MTVALPSDSGPNARQPPSSSEERHRPIPILIVDKSPLSRAGLAHILAASPFRVTATCSSLSELSEEVLGENPSVLLLSVYEEVPAIMRQLGSLTERGLYIVVLTQRFRPEELVDALTAGVAGYFLKDEVSSDVLVKAPELALLGGAIISKSLTTAANDWVQLQRNTASTVRVPNTGLGGQPHAANNAAQTDSMSQLSNRERRVLDLLGQGLSNKHIARQLNIADATAKVHIKSIFRKIGINNRTQAAVWARDRVRPNEQSEPQPLVSSPAVEDTDRISETIPKDDAFSREGLRTPPDFVEIDFQGRRFG